MSKKKAAGSTMTLKDFHGGSIPSDLPLPSAPGVIPKNTTDRPVFDRVPWGNRSDQSIRPSSSHTIRNFDDKSLFLPHTANIGRNFSEDERKPLDGHSGPRRMISDDVFKVANSRLDVRHSGWSEPSGNAWNGRKEVNNERGQVSSWTTTIQPAAASEHLLPSQKAFDAVIESRGGYRTNNGGDDKSLFLPHTANIGRNFSEDERKPLDGHSAPRRMISDDVFQVANSRLEAKPDLGRHSGWSSAASGPDMTWNSNAVSSVPWNGRKEVSVVSNERGQSAPWTSITQPAAASEQVSAGRWQSELLLPSQKAFDAVIESRGGYKSNGHVVNQGDEPHVVSEVPVDIKEAKTVAMSISKPDLVQPTPSSEVFERPKLKLMPRTKPIESIEKPVNEGKVESAASNQKSVNALKPVTEILNQPVERPKLNLKTVTQKLEQPEVKTEKERNAVFGGARPREQVLKERGIDEIEHHELEQQLERMVVNVNDRVPEHASQRLPINSPRDLRTRKLDQKDGRGVSDTARSETQRRNWRDNDIKSSRPQQQQQQQRTQEKTRHPSPETWRKPVVQKPESPPDGTGIRHGKAASALVLAQAYSPFSDTKSGISSNLLSRNNQTQQQQPFSRLVGSTTTTTRYTNGY